MDATLRSMLNETEKGLLRAAEPKALKKLDEDGLAELHDRIRRARNKYSKLYRRRAGAQVKSDRARKQASASHAKTSRKAEGFEDALARVSTALAAEAAKSAESLKAERLAAAKRKPVPSDGSSSKKSKGSKGRTGAKKKTPATKKQHSSTKASGKRKQASRDRRS
jgi:hypothetical protein